MKVHPGERSHLIQGLSPQSLKAIHRNETGLRWNGLGSMVTRLANSKLFHAFNVIHLRRPTPSLVSYGQIDLLGILP